MAAEILIEFAELFWLSIFILIGVIVALFSQKFKFPDILLLLIVGTVISKFANTGLQDSHAFLTGLGIFALVMLIFDSTSKFKPKEINQLSPYAIKLSLVFLGCTLVGLTIVTHFVFEGDMTIKGWLLSLLFAGVMAGTSPSSTLSLLSHKSSKIIDIIKFESIFNTPFTVIIPLIVIGLYTGFGDNGIIETAGTVIVTFLQEIIIGVGAGVVIGLVVFRIMKNFYLEKLSPLLLIATALVTYTIADNLLNGSGVLAVTALGFIYGISEVKNKEGIAHFTSIFTEFLKISVFILLGVLIIIPLNSDFLVKSSFLFFAYLIIRFIAVGFTFRSSDLGWKEKLFMSMNVSKGVAVAVVGLFIFSTISGDVPYRDTILNLIYVFIFYSIIMASISAKFVNFLLPSATSIKDIKGVQKKKDKKEKEKVEKQIQKINEEIHKQEGELTGTESVPKIEQAIKNKKVLFKKKK